MNAEPSGSRTDPPQERRGFLMQALAIVAGGIATLVPVVIGIVFSFDPLRRRERLVPSDVESLVDADGFIRVAYIDAIPDDGTPRLFRVVADRVDAWTYQPQRPIGAVYLRKVDPETANGGNSLVAFTVVCPHLGCGVNYKPQQNEFHCPCHNSSFSITGKRSASSPSARNLDTLLVKLGEDGAVFVKYQEFQSGTAEKIAEA